MSAMPTTLGDLAKVFADLTAQYGHLHPQVEPQLLKDVLFMKRARADYDADQFKMVACDEFASKLNATIGGAAWAMRQWIGAQEAGNQIWNSPARLIERKAFLADLDAVLAGDRIGWTPPHERAA